MTLQNPADFEMETGLEDFGMDDAIIPRLKINHKENCFEDSLSNEQFDSVRVIFLGLVKQRSLWHTTVDDGDWPMCRSGNFTIGFPDLNEKQPRDKMFPWEKSGFNPADYPPGEDGLRRLPCANCQLKEWGTHPDGKKPYCSEQFTLPVLYDPREDGGWVPAIMTFQKTSMSPIKSYLTSFSRSKNAAYSAITEITLDQRKKGTTDYSVPKFQRIGDTEQENWREYAVNYRTIRDFLEADPGVDDTDPEGQTPVVSKTAAQATVATVQETEDPNIVDAEVVEEPPAPEVKKEETKAAAAPPAPAAAADDDDLPF